MEGQFWGVLQTHPFLVVVIVIGGFLVISTLLGAHDKIHNVLGYKTKAEVERHDYEENEKKRDEQIDEMWREIKDMREETRREIKDMREENQKSFKELSIDLKNVREADIMVLGDRISQRSAHYLSVGSIPVDEVPEFQSMYETYKAIGGNHGVDKIFEKTMSKLSLTTPTDMEDTHI